MAFSKISKIILILLVIITSIQSLMLGYRFFEIQKQVEGSSIFSMLSSFEEGVERSRVNDEITLLNKEVNSLNFLKNVQEKPVEQATQTAYNAGGNANNANYNYQPKNLLYYPKYGINANIVYSTRDDVYNSDGTPKNTGALNSSFQQKLKRGILHLYSTPLPGEVGNSYIVGHSSDYCPCTKYSRIFKPLEKRSQVGEIFYIYNSQGQKMTFRVFEVLELRNVDSPEAMQEAYKSFGNKRVVTLQTSIFVSASQIDRWLTRGELI